ncbi:MAG: hypothetical protein ACOCXZ_03680 [Chloroflexota bacterium]
MFQADEVTAPDQVRLIIPEHIGFITGTDRSLRDKPDLYTLWFDQVVTLAPVGLFIAVIYVFGLWLLNLQLSTAIPLAIAVGLAFLLAVGFWFGRESLRRINEMEAHGKVIKGRLTDIRQTRVLTLWGYEPRVELRYTFRTIDGQIHGRHLFPPEILPGDQLPEVGAKVAVLYLNDRENQVL